MLSTPDGIACFNFSIGIIKRRSSLRLDTDSSLFQFLNRYYQKVCTRNSCIGLSQEFQFLNRYYQKQILQERSHNGYGFNSSIGIIKSGCTFMKSSCCFPSFNSSIGIIKSEWTHHYAKLGRAFQFLNRYYQKATTFFQWDGLKEFQFLNRYYQKGYF